MRISTPLCAAVQCLHENSVGAHDTVPHKERENQEFCGTMKLLRDLA